MKNLKAKIEERADKESKFEALVVAAEGRELTELETSQLSTLEDDIKKLDAEIAPLQSISDRKAKIASKKAASAVGAVQDNFSEDKEMSRFSYNKAFADIRNNGKGLGSLKGFEQEIFEEAVKEAKTKAEGIAKSLGMRLGDVQYYSEDNGSYPIMYGKGMGGNATMSVAPEAARDMAVPVSQGTDKVTVTVNITYELR